MAFCAPNLRRTGAFYRLLPALFLLLAATAPACFAQSQPEASSADVVRAFEPAPNQEYELGRGDEITVDVFSRPELTSKRVVGPDGRITVPPAGDIEVAGKTRAQASAAVLAALSSYYHDLTVTISVDRYASNHVLLLGAVDRPGIVTFETAPTLLEVIARGASPAASAQASSTGSVSPGEGSGPITVPEICMIYRGPSMITVHLRELLRNGDAAANVRLKRDDIVFVPGEKPYVSVLGSVSHPGVLRLDSASTLPRLIAEAGGFSEKAGKYPKIAIIHPPNGNAVGAIETVSFRDVIDAKLLRLRLRSGDVLYVPESGFNQAADVLQKVSPLISLVTVGALLGQQQ